jgi:uncharacterized protein YjdB
MKKRLVLTFAASALLVLAGCGNPKTSSSVVPASSEPGTSSVVYTAVAITNKTDLTAAWRVGDDNRLMSLSITPEANVTQLLNEGKLTITSSDAGVVSVIGAYLSPVAAGTATITATFGGLTDTVSITVAPLVITAVKDITAAGKFTMNALVTAVGTKGYMLDDGTGAIYVYGSLPSGFKVGDYVQADATMSIYYGIAELSAATLKKLTTTKPTIADPVELTPTQLDTWAAASWTKTAITLATKDTKKFKATLTAKKVGDYVELFFDGNEHAVGGLGLPTTISWVEGKSYDIVGYCAGWNNSSKYLQTVVVSSAEHVYAPTSLTVTAAGDATSVAVGGTLQLSAAVLPIHASQDVVWSSDDTAGTYATISATGLVTAIAENSTGVTFTATSKSVATVLNSIKITIDPKPADPVTSITLDKTSLSLAVTDSSAALVATVLPATALTSYTWSSEDETIATVNAGVVKAVAVGTTNIVATTDGKDGTGAKLVAKCAVTVTALPGAITKTVAEVLAMTESDSSNLYSVTGVAENITNAQSGSFYLTDPASGASIVIYGGYTSGATYTYADKALTFDKTNGVLVTDAVIGKTITVTGTASVFSSKGQIKNGIISNVSDTAGTFTATIATPENGTASLGAEKDLAIGTTVTVTVAPSEGYEVNTVVVDHGYATSACTLVSATSYTFVSGAYNAVTVKFRKIVNYSKVASYTGIVSTVTTALTADSMKTLLSGKADTTTTGLADIITSVDSVANGSQGYTGFLSLGMKFGTSKATGSFTLTLSKAVGKVVVSAIGWTATDTLKVGDADAQTLAGPYSTAGATTSAYTFIITEATTVTFTTTNRAFINAIEFYSVAA